MVYSRVCNICIYISVNMGVVNGRKGRDAFTCVSSKGCSVVDYCIVGVDNIDLIDNFKVATMSECIEEMQCGGDITIECQIILWCSGRCL